MKQITLLPRETTKYSIALRVQPTSSTTTFYAIVYVFTVYRKEIESTKFMSCTTGRIDKEWLLFEGASVFTASWKKGFQFL